ncbi:ABC transporter ATP-binding protein|uniref:Iron complex transport system ATP-binding protein n=1 Tax=Dendrosporobacter quercicolus TaxID=146817 RepID=A0A1G9QYN5_9FIRM|nr:ABC transporter ATP-binding protein [Dendrosporobacter quercicolus]NSL48414.1 ABC transporter ATP-binding protein [Dendrosporobacter quercicolus DSM 1736]SDM16063.1 iron complex transport system ATP-binding protein [Dendrosporobacter quercicolus]
MSILNASNLAVSIGGKAILKNISLAVPTGRITAILGPNGSGKSTLLKALSRVLPPQAGTVLLGGRNLNSLGSRELARRMAVLPQAPQSPPDLTVRDLVEHGRFPHRSWWKTAAADQAIVNWALEQTGVRIMADRLVSTLSGGERQRTWIAMALAQQPEVLLLDEPTTYLDICHQLEIMQLAARLNVDNGITVVMVLHDINQAAQYADHIAVLKDGTVFAAGPPEEVVNSAMLREVFRVEADVLPAAGGRPVFVVTGLAAARKD